MLRAIGLTAADRGRVYRKFSAMFSLIISIISIALVAGLALAALYYGGAALKNSEAQARALKIINEGQQLLAAANLFKADRGVYPDSVLSLVREGYLKSPPSALGFVGAAHADTQMSEWAMPGAGVPVFVLDVTSSDTCRALNMKSYGEDGVLPTIRTQYVSQCWGSMEGDTITRMQVVVAAGAHSFHEAANVLDAELSDAALPGPSVTGDWVVQPTRSTSTPPAPSLASVTAGSESCRTYMNGNYRDYHSYAHLYLKVAKNDWYHDAMASGGITLELRTKYWSSVDSGSSYGYWGSSVGLEEHSEGLFVLGYVYNHGSYTSVPVESDLLSSDPNAPDTLRLIPRSGQQPPVAIEMYCSGGSPVIRSVTHGW